MSTSKQTRPPSRVVLWALVVLAAVGAVSAYIALGPGATDFAHGRRVALRDYSGHDPTGVPKELAGASLIERGEYLTRAADCLVCHTAKDGTPFIGGRAFVLPFGTLYSTNITPDSQLSVKWSEWLELPEQMRLWEHVRGTKIVKDDVTSNIGDSAHALSGAAQRLSATYDFAIHTHGSIGPSCAVAQWEGDRLTCWNAAQSPHNLRKQLAAMFSLKDEQVHCIYIEGSGCYGRNGHEDAAADAALLARAVNAPVRAQWMRADEHGWDPKGPPTLLDMRAGFDSRGKIDAWESELYIPDGVAGFVALVGADHAKLNSLGTLSPGGVLNDLAIPYAIDNVKTTAHRLESTPLKPAWIRSPGRMQNSFANESFFDEIAAHLGSDPLDARLRYLRDDRGKEVLERLATLSGWRHRPKPDRHATKSVGRGLAYVKYELVRTYVGMVCEVEVNRETGEIAVKKFYVAHDCGQIINPDGVRNQIEGNVVQSVSRVMQEEVRFNRSRVTSVDWASYPILRFPDVPAVVMDLIDRPQEAPWGAGEPTAALVPGAISNAVYDAIGVRLRSVPFTPGKVKAAIERGNG